LQNHAGSSYNFKSKTFLVRQRTSVFPEEESPWLYLLISSSAYRRVSQ
jgi:hypothetical protein